MTKEELAALLNGRVYGREITEAEEAQAKAAGLIVVFGASDDLIEFRGALNDEVGKYGDSRVSLTSEASLMPDWESIDHSDQDDAREFFRKERLVTAHIDCEWAPADDANVSWRLTATVPHAKFDVMEDGDVYCRALVIAVADLTA